MENIVLEGKIFEGENKANFEKFFWSQLWPIVQENLKNNKEQVRVSGMTLLQKTLSQILQRQHDELAEYTKIILHIIQIVLDKVRDIYCAYHSVQIISEFVSLAPQRLPQIFQRDLINSILKHCSSPVFHVPAYNYKTRHCVFKIYQSFILNKKLLLDQIDLSSYITAVLSGIDEEKDPRNLLISYDLLYFLLRNFAPNLDEVESIKVITPFIDEIFDKISCYFPINFVPPKNDKYNITPEQLKEKLNRCFLASPLLVNSAFPFILDKLSASQIETKMECFKLLQKMIEQYEPYSLIEKHIQVTLHQLMNEFFNQYEDELQKVAGETMAILLKRINEQYQSGVSKIGNTQYIDQVIERCHTEINDSPESITAFIATDLLSVIVVQNSNLQEYVLKTFLEDKIIDPLIEKAIDSLAKQSAFIQIATNIVKKISESPVNKAAQDFFLRINNKIILIIDISFDSIKDNPVLFEKGLKLLSCLSSLANFKQILVSSLDNCQQDCQMETEDDFNQLNSKDRLTKYMINLRDIFFNNGIGQDMQHVIIEQLDKISLAMPKLISMVFIPQMREVFKNERASFSSNQKVIQLLTYALKDFSAVETSIDIFKEYFATSQVNKQNEAIILALQKPLTNFIPINDQDNVKFNYLLKESFLYFMEQLPQSIQLNTLIVDFLKAMILKLDNIQNEAILRTLLDIKESIIRPQFKLIQYIMKNKNLKFTHLYKDPLFLKFYKIGISVQEEYLVIQFGRALSYFMLREPQKMNENLLNLIQTTLNNDHTHIIVRLYICKAFIKRGEQIGFVKLKNLVTNSQSCSQAIHYYGRIVAKYHENICKEKGFTVTKLYPQRLFNTLYPVFKELINDEQSSQFGIQLMMETCSLVQLTQLQDKLLDLIPIAEKALQLHNTPQVKLTSLQLFRKILIENNELGASYVDSFLPSILESIHVDSIQLKVEGLHTLTQISLYPKSLIGKYVDAVTKEVTKLLDHKKRMIRKFARNCINEWQILNA